MIRRLVQVMDISSQLKQQRLKHGRNQLRTQEKLITVFGTTAPFSSNAGITFVLPMPIIATWLVTITGARYVPPTFPMLLKVIVPPLRSAEDSFPSFPAAWSLFNSAAISIMLSC